MFYDDGPNRYFASPADGGQEMMVEAMVPLAILAFNERRSDLIPKLATLNCNKNLSLEWVCSAGGNPRVAFSYALELLNLPYRYPHFIVGPGYSKEAMTMSMATVDTPIIGHWTTSPRLSSKDLFPSFTRTIYSDFAGASLAARLTLALGFSRVALLHESSDFGAGFKDALFTEMSNFNISLKFSAFDSEDQPTTDRAMQTIKESKLNGVFVVHLKPDLPYLAEAFVKQQMENQGVLFIFLTVENVDALISGDGINEPNDDIAKMMHGSLFFTFSVTPNPRFTQFKDLMARGEFEHYSQQVSDMFPPNNLGNDPNSCDNSNVDYALPKGFLNSTGPQVARGWDIWAWTFDTVISGGLALCELYPSDPLPTTPFGQELFDRILQMDFQGMSGHVKFSQGDRDPLSAFYVLKNRRRVAPFVLETINVGGWNGQTEEWDVAFGNITYSLGTNQLPSETVLPVHITNNLPYGLKAWGWVEVTLLNVLCLLCLVWLFVKRKTRVVINTQGKLMALMVLGCMVASWSVFTLTLEDDDVTFLPLVSNDMACMASPVLFSFGFQLALTTIIFKVYRLFVIFEASKTLKHVSFSMPRVLTMIGAVMVAQLILLVLWIVLAPMTFERQVTQKDEFNNPVNSFGKCTGSNSSIAFGAVVFLLQGIALVGTGLASTYMRDLPAEFEESRFINLAVVSNAQVFVIAVPSVIAVYFNPVGKFVICSTVVLASVLALIGFLLFPKMFPSVFDLKMSSSSNKSPQAIVNSPHKSRVVSSKKQQVEDDRDNTFQETAVSNPVYTQEEIKTQEGTV